MSDSTRPAKPSKDFPLFPHRSGRWAKKVRGSFCYFGKWADDPKGEKALQLWLDQRDDLLAGRKPRAKLDAMTVEDLADKFLHAKKARVDTGELAELTWHDYRKRLVIVVETLGRNRVASDVGPDDWAKLRDVFAKRWGPSRLANAIVHTKGVWKWAWENGLLASPMRFGSGFTRPPAKAIRAAKNAKGPRMFTPEQLRAILDVANPTTKALVLLGINGALGNTDLAMMPVTAVDLENGWVNYARQKTAIMRRIPLWPQTVEAIREVLAIRATKNRGNTGLLFLRRSGASYRGKRTGSAISEAYAAAAKLAGVEGRAFYDCRRTFATIAERAKDPVALSFVMGHIAGSGDMASVYRQFIPDDRLRAVVQTVHDWLYADDPREDDDTDTDTDDAPLSIAVHRARKAIADTAGPIQDTLKGVWLPEITKAVRGDVEARKRVISTWGEQNEQFRVVGA